MEVLPPWAAVVGAEGRKLWPVNSVATLDKTGEAHALFPPSEKSEDFGATLRGHNFSLKKKSTCFFSCYFHM